MMRVAELVGSDPLDDPDLPVPATRPAMPVPLGIGNDRQVAMRGLAEQLVCEVNAVLAEEDDHMTLVDEVVGNELTFLVNYRGRAARVSTGFLDGMAYGSFAADGLAFEEPQELSGPESLPDLLLLLLQESDTPRHPHA